MPALKISLGRVLLHLVPYDADFYPAVPILFVNLLFYFIILLADQDTLKNKVLKLIPDTALGIVSGMVFMNG